MKCPGQDTQYWTAGAIYDAPCPQCGQKVEFFKDDTSRKCSACGHRFINPNLDFGCASYCQFAEQCLGDLPPELVAQKEDLLKDRVAVAVKRHLKSDFRTIGRAMRRARYAEQIGKSAKVNLSVVLMAAYLWDLDVWDAEDAITGVAPVAHTILGGLMAPEPLMRGVIDLLVAGHRNHELKTAQGRAELRVVLDAGRKIAEEGQEKTATSSAA